MKASIPRRLIAFALIASVLSMTAANISGPREQRPSEQVFKYIQSMKGIPADEFMSTMGFFSASLGISCGDCHTAESGGDWSKYADDSALKQPHPRG